MTNDITINTGPRYGLLIRNEQGEQLWPNADNIVSDEMIAVLRKYRMFGHWKIHAENGDVLADFTVEPL
jgi:hypothetical protein